MKAKSNVVLLVPGIFDRGHSMLLMQQALRLAGFSAHYLHLQYNSGWHGMELLSHQLKSRVEALTERGTTCSIVGFSMGGIVTRHYLQALGGLEQVHKFISISSPHYGSYWAGFLPYRGGHQLRVGSDFLRALNDDVERLGPTAPVSIWTPYDITIVPHTSSLLPLGNTYEVPVKLHRWMPLDERVISIVNDELNAGMQE